MKCCVPLCRSTGENHPITIDDTQERITFHRFPTTLEQQAVWLEMLGLSESDLPPSAVVCSEHFKTYDFIVMSDGTVKLKKDAVPLQFCMICLTYGNSKMYLIHQNHLGKAYTSITGISVNHIREKINILPRLCVECAQRLEGYNRFRNKGLRAYKSLLQIIEHDQKLTSDNLKSINRVGKQLTSNIKKRTFAPDHCDLYVKYDEEDNSKHTEEEFSTDIKKNTNIKREKCEDTEDDVANQSESDDFQNDFHTNDDIDDDNKLYYNIEIENCIDEDKFEKIDDNNAISPDVTNVIKNEDVVLMVIKKDNVKSPKKNVEQTSSKSKILKPTVPEPKKRKKPEPRIPKPEKKPEPCVPKPKKEVPFGKCFTKTILSYEEQIAEVQSRQYTEHYKSYRYKCDICFTGRWSLFTYKRHMEKHTAKHGKYECAICGLRHKTRTQIRLHVQAHAERYSCTRCDFVTGLRQLLDYHARWHSGQAFDCPHCDAKFRKKSTYFSHLRLKHPSDFACPLCGFSFVSERGVKVHLIMIHHSKDVRNLSGPSCEQCDVRFASQDAYDTHMSVSPKHSSGIPMRNETQYEPRIRRPKLKLEGTIRKGRKKVKAKPAPPGNRPDKPRVGRPRKISSDEHQEGCPQTKHRLCEVCGKSFQAPWALAQHMNTHTGDKPFKCDFCSKSYTSQVALKYHLRAHSELPQPYSCSVCHRGFSFWSNRQRHMRIHNPERPTFTCDLCDKSFTSHTSKAKHVAHVHDKVPWPQRNRDRRLARKRKHSEDKSDWCANMADSDDAKMAVSDDAKMADSDDAKMADSDDAKMADSDDANMADSVGESQGGIFGA